MLRSPIAREPVPDAWRIRKGRLVGFILPATTVVDVYINVRGRAGLRNWPWCPCRLIKALPLEAPAYYLMPSAAGMSFEARGELIGIHKGADESPWIGRRLRQQANSMDDEVREIPCSETLNIYIQIVSPPATR
jgi:hypothetical protein